MNRSATDLDTGICRPLTWMVASKKIIWLIDERLQLKMELLCWFLETTLIAAAVLLLMKVVKKATVTACCLDEREEPGD